MALMGMGVGAVGASATSIVGAGWPPIVSTLFLWLGLAFGIAYAIRLSRPTGLLRFRSIDVLWGVCVGAGLRLLQGLLSGKEARFPTVLSLDGGLPQDWLFANALPSALGGPVLEELFFRAVILITVYQLLRRSVGILTAGVTALLASTGTFVILHAVTGSLSLMDALQLFAVGAACSLAVLLTGRIWGAIIAHMFYNITYLVLAVVGTLLS